MSAASERKERLRVLVFVRHAPWRRDVGIAMAMDHILPRLAQRADVTLALPAKELQDGVPELPYRVEAATPTEAEVARWRVRRPTLPERIFRRNLGRDEDVAAWMHSRVGPERFDAALVNAAIPGQYIPLMRVPAVWNLADDWVLYALLEMRRQPPWRWPHMLKQAATYAFYERWVGRHAATTVAVSSLDAAFCRRWIDGPVAIVQNGADFDYFRPAEQAPEPGVVTFVGSLSFAPNIDAIRFFGLKVWPRLMAGGAGKRLLVVGRRPGPEVEPLRRVPGVELHTDVPDVRPFVARASAVVVPTRKGGGIKNKILEACAMRRPVVASRRALFGLSARIGRDVLCATTPTQWVRQLTRVLTQPALAEQVAAGGLAWVRAKHDWDDFAEGYLAAMRRGVEDARAAAARPSRGGVPGLDPTPA